VRRSAPPASMCVAKLCLSVCGLTVEGKPARLQYFFTSAQRKIRVNGRPVLLTNSRLGVGSRESGVGNLPADFPAPGL
jgi:hypothetical protein